MQNKEFLQAYLNAYAPVGQETQGQKIWTDYIKQFTNDVKLDAYGTAYAKLEGITPIQELGRTHVKPHKVVIEAHCDEIAWMITHIESDGYVRVKRHGGSDNMIAASKTVLIHTHDNTTVKALFECICSIVS